MSPVRRVALIIIAFCFVTLRPAFAQQGVFIQVEAQPSLARAEERARDYASFLQNVNGFALGAGWYGIALGPYSEDAAAALLTRLRRAGQIPSDSYIVTPDRLQRQFWPVGAALNAQPRPAPLPDPAEPAAEPIPAPVPEPAPAPQFQTADETPREARASESALNRSERETLQVMLKWAGVYDAAIDGAFGRGTRAAMELWQERNGYEPTGVLTTGQRAALARQYNAVLDGLGMAPVEDARAGIRIDMPTAVVAFEKYDSPFVHYGATGDLGARVLLISQPGDQSTLFGLYDIMQTLEIVPLEGPRERGRQGFTLTGANDRIVSHTEARLSGGAIKGFTLVWPAGDEERRTRVLARMQDSFETTPAVLDPSAIADDGQAVDLLAGLEIRQPGVTQSGFFVDKGGAIVTTLDGVQSCGRITIDDQYEASVAASDETLGVALLKPAEALAPMHVAAFRTDTPRLQSEVAVAGYSYGGALGAPSLTFGTLADLAGLGGNDSIKRLALAALPGDAGGPVLDTGGAVLGMLLPRSDSDRQLPADVSFALKADALRDMIARAGLTADATQGEVAMDPVDLTTVATGMTVLVSCWE